MPIYVESRPPIPKRKKSEEEQLASAVTAQSSTTAQPATVTSTPSSSTSQGQTTSPYDLIQPRQWSPETQRALDEYRSLVNAAPVTAADVMRSPEYQDLARGVQYQADKAQAGMYRDFASRGAFGSKQAGLANAEMRGAYQAQLAGLIPQLIQAETARRQQQIANLSNLLSAVSGLESTAFNQGVTAFNTTAPYTRKTIGQQMEEEQFNKNFALNEAGITGQYQPQAALQLANAIIAHKESYANPNDGTTPAEDSARATAARNALVAMGFRPEQIDSLFGPNVTLEQARENIKALALPTMQARQTEAQMFGTYGGKPTLQGQAAQQGLEMGALELDVAKNPEYGIAAQAQQGMQRGALDMANTQSLISSRQAEAARAGQPKPKTPEEIRSERIDLLSPYDITPTAKNVWVDLEDALNSIRAQTGQIDRTQATPLLQSMLAVPGLTTKDRKFIAQMFAGYFGDDIAPYLETYRKGYKPPEELPY